MPSLSSSTKKKRKRKALAASPNRQWVDACLNDTTIDALTIKERATVATTTLSYSSTSASVYETIESYVESRRKTKNSTTKQQKDTNKNDPGMHAFASIRRITLELSSQVDEIARSLTGQVYNSLMEDYDLVAVRPTSDKTFQYACTTMDVDCISIHLGSSSSNGMVMRRQLIQQAVDRGVAFEIPYTGFLQQQRLQFISNARALVRATRGKNIVCSSMCESVYDMRGPYDVVNLLIVFLGLTEEQAYDCLSTTPMRLIERRRQLYLRGRKNVILVHHHQEDGDTRDARKGHDEQKEGERKQQLFDIS